MSEPFISTTPPHPEQLINLHERAIRLLNMANDGMSFEGFKTKSAELGLVCLRSRGIAVDHSLTIDARSPDLRLVRLKDSFRIHNQDQFTQELRMVTLYADGRPTLVTESTQMFERSLASSLPISGKKVTTHLITEEDCQSTAESLESIAQTARRKHHFLRAILGKAAIF